MNTLRKVVASGAIAGLAIAGGAVGASLLGTADAATPSPSPSAGASASSSTATDPNPGDNGADGVPEAQEHHGGHGGHGGALDLSGTVTAVGTSSVTIKTSTGTTAYTVTSSSDIDKDGEAALKDLAVGDAVTFSVDSTNTKQIDKLHAGDETKDAPTGATASDSASDT